MLAKMATLMTSKSKEKHSQLGCKLSQNLSFSFYSVYGFFLVINHFSTQSNGNWDDIEI